MTRLHNTISLFAAFATLSGIAAAALLASRDNTDYPLGPDHFIPLKISSINALTDDASIIKLSVPSARVPKVSDLDAFSIHHIYVKQPDLQIQRPYTPLTSSFLRSGPDSESEISILVKRYADGEVSRWLHRLKVGDEVEIRGPLPTWRPPTDGLEVAADELIFVS